MLAAGTGSVAQNVPVTVDGAVKLPAWDVVSVHPADPAHCTQGGTIRYSSDGREAPQHHGLVILPGPDA